MRKKYPVSLLCRLLDVSRSGYYKWRRRRGIKNRYEKDRELLTELLYSHHLRHPSYGYHRLSVSVFRETGWIFSHNLAHKCCKQAGIHSKARKHGKYRKPGEESIRFPNIVRGKWHPKEPLQIVTSDMTMFRSGGKQYEWTLLIDAFNNEILAHKVSDKPGDNRPYYHVLEELLQLSKLKKEKTAPIVFHSDQGAVYSSRAFYKAHEQYTTLQRSMSRVGTPTDNPVIEALNGWIKEELMTDFDLAHAKNVQKLLDDYASSCIAIQKPRPVQTGTGLLMLFIGVYLLLTGSQQMLQVLFLCLFVCCLPASRNSAYCQKSSLSNRPMFAALKTGFLPSFLCRS